MQDRGDFRLRRPCHKYEVDEDQDAGSLHDYKRVIVRNCSFFSLVCGDSSQHCASVAADQGQFQNTRQGSSFSAALSTITVFLASMIMQVMVWTEETFFNAAYPYVGRSHVLRSFATITPINYHDVEMLDYMGSHPLCQISDTQV